LVRTLNETRNQHGNYFWKVSRS